MFSKRTRNLTVAVLALIMALTLSFGLFGFNTQVNATTYPSLEFTSSYSSVSSGQSSKINDNIQLVVGSSSSSLDTAQNKMGYRCDYGRGIFLFRYTETVVVDLFVNANGGSGRSFGMYNVGDVALSTATHTSVITLMTNTNCIAPDAKVAAHTNTNNVAFAAKDATFTYDEATKIITYAGTGGLKVTYTLNANTTYAFGTTNSAHKSTLALYSIDITSTGPVAVTGFKTLSDQNIYLGETYTLPEKIEDSNGNQVPVKWADSSDATVTAYTPTAAGEATFKASINSPDGSFTGEATATLKVVSSVLPLKALTNTVTLYLNDGGYTFPATLEAENGKQVAVTWTDASGNLVTAYNPTQESENGEHTFTATMNDATYLGASTTTLKINVAGAIVRTLSAFAGTLENYEVLVGQTFAQANLPETVTLNWTATNNTTGTVAVKVQWDESKFDSSAEGTLTITGTLQETTGYVLPENKTVTATVTVKVETIGAVTLASKLFYNTSNNTLYGPTTYAVEGKGEFEIKWNAYVAGSKTLTGKLAEKTGFNVTNATVTATVVENAKASSSINFVNASIQGDLTGFVTDGTWTHGFLEGNAKNCQYLGYKGNEATITILLEKTSTVVLSLGGNSSGEFVFNGKSVKSGAGKVVNVEQQLAPGAYDLRSTVKGKNQFIRYIEIYNEDSETFRASVDTDKTANGNTLPILPEKEGFVLKGWTADDGATYVNGGTSVLAQETTKWNSNIDYYAGTVYTAVYEEPIDVNKNYTVTFEVNNELYGETSVGSVEVLYGTAITVNGATLTIGEYTITAIAKAPSAESTYTFAQWNLNGHTNVDGTITLTAEFTAVPREYEITYTSVNGTVTGKAAAKVGEEVQVTATPNAGYVLDSLTYGGNPMSITIQKFKMPASNVEVKAEFSNALAAKWAGYGDLTNGNASFGERGQLPSNEATTGGATTGSVVCKGVDGVEITISNPYFDIRRKGHYPLASIDNTSADSKITIVVPETVPYKVNIKIVGMTYGNTNKTATGYLKAGEKQVASADFSNSGFVNANNANTKFSDLGSCSPKELVATGLEPGTYTFTAETNRIFVNMVSVEKSTENLLGNFNGETVYGRLCFMGTSLRTTSPTGARYGFKFILSTANEQTLEDVAIAITTATFNLKVGENEPLVFEAKSCKIEGNSLLINIVIVDEFDCENNESHRTLCNTDITATLTLNIGELTFTAQGTRKIVDIATEAYNANQIDEALAKKYGYVAPQA